MADRGHGGIDYLALVEGLFFMAAAEGLLSMLAIVVDGRGHSIHPPVEKGLTGQSIPSALVDGIDHPTYVDSSALCFSILFAVDYGRSYWPSAGMGGYLFIVLPKS